jgi:biopolymer transport protein ExbD
MKRSDRRDGSYDNSVNNPQSHKPEPLSPKEAQQLLVTLRAQKNELTQKVQEAEQQTTQTLQLYSEEQQRYQTTLTLYQEEQQKYTSTITLYQETKAQAESYFSLYDQEKARTSELLIQFETIQTERDHYITLYNEAQSELKFERHSKASIKGWETRRKRENERLKQEIGEMTLIVRDSLARKDAAISNLEELANRMDRIQNLVDSVESSPTDNPLGLVQKFKRIWQAVQDILAE